VVWFPESDPKAFFHELLVLALNRYYSDLHATLEYYCIEHKHPLRRSHWDTELTIKSLDATMKIHRVESKHLSRVSRATTKDSMADAAYEALVYYCGRRFEEAQYDATYHFPSLRARGNGLDHRGS
jgi:hypothetical protein